MSVRQGTNTIAGAGYTKSEVDTLLTGKADTALSNITATGKEVCAHMAMPSDKYINLTLGASGTQYTAPADGWFALSKVTTANGQFIQLGQYGKVSNFCWSGSQYNACVTSIPVKKDQTITIDYTAAGSATFSFFYTNGAQ